MSEEITIILYFIIAIALLSTAYKTLMMYLAVILSHRYNQPEIFYIRNIQQDDLTHPLFSNIILRLLKYKLFRITHSEVLKCNYLITRRNIDEIEQVQKVYTVYPDLLYYLGERNE